MSINWNFPYPSQRMPVFANNIVATSQPLAAQAGLKMLLQGGNAVDAALATAIALTVVEPTSNGIGADAFAIIWDGEHIHGLNGSGRSPRALTAERFAGLSEMPLLGWDPVTVPGCVDAWVKMSQKFGRLPFVNLFTPAIDYARDGFIVSPKTAERWLDAEVLYKNFPAFKKTFLPQGRAPRTGDVFQCPDQAQTLQDIATSRGESFYRGRLAECMAATAKSDGGLLALDDLAQHRSEWVQPISVDYRGKYLHEIPPNGQGLAALIALGILRHHEIARYSPDSADSLHLQIEAMKIAFSETSRHLADPGHMVVEPTDFLQDTYLTQRADEICMERAASPESKMPRENGTVYLTTADADGMLVSFIQSNYLGFGSGIVVPGTGISLQNRGYGFVLDQHHPNGVGGGKKPYHTIIPGFVSHAGRPLMSFGVMGGHMQAQGHVQMMVRIFDYGQNPQAACDAPRWYVEEDFQVGLEPGFPNTLREELQRRGHRVMDQAPGHLFGGAQLIFCLENGYCAASDARKDGQAVGY